MGKIGTERLLLRSLISDDSGRIEELAGEYDVAKSTLNIPHPVTLEVISHLFIPLFCTINR